MNREIRGVANAKLPGGDWLPPPRVMHQFHDRNVINIPTPLLSGLTTAGSTDSPPGFWAQQGAEGDTFRVISIPSLQVANSNTSDRLWVTFNRPVFDPHNCIAMLPGDTVRVWGGFRSFACALRSYPDPTVSAGTVPAAGLHANLQISTGIDYFPQQYGGDLGQLNRVQQGTIVTPALGAALPGAHAVSLPSAVYATSAQQYILQTTQGSIEKQWNCNVTGADFTAINDNESWQTASASPLFALPPATWAAREALAPNNYPYLYNGGRKLFMGWRVDSVTVAGGTITIGILTGFLNDADSSIKWSVLETTHIFAATNATMQFFSSYHENDMFHFICPFIQIGNAGNAIVAAVSAWMPGDATIT